MVAAALGPGLEPRRVEPGIGLGHRKAGLLSPGDQGRQKPPLLLVIAEDDNRVQPEDVHVDRRGTAEPGARLGNRLHQYRRLGDAEPTAAILRRHRDAEPPGLRHRPMEFVRKPALGVLREPIIVAEPLAQPRHRRPDLPLLLGQGKGHLTLLRGRRSVRRIDPDGRILIFSTEKNGGAHPCHSTSCPASARTTARAPARWRSSASTATASADPRRREPDLHAWRRLRQGRALCRAPPPPRPPVAAVAPHRRQGRRRSRLPAISWDDALDEVAERLTRAAQRHGSEAVWPYYYAGTMGLVQRDGINRLRHAMRYSREDLTICTC